MTVFRFDSLGEYSYVNKVLGSATGPLVSEQVTAADHGNGQLSQLGHRCPLLARSEGNSINLGEHFNAKQRHSNTEDLSWRQ